MSLEVRPVRGRRELASFVDLPWRLYRHDPLWVPPLKASVRELLDQARHPFYDGGRAAERELFLAVRDGRVVGRVAAILNHAHVQYHRERLGFFGFFECEEDPEAARELLRSAEGWLGAKGAEAVRGPANPSTNYECGLLVEGFDAPPKIMMPHNPPFYAGLVEAAGYAKEKDLYAYLSDVHGAHLERLLRLAERTRERHPELSTRGVELSDFDAEVAVVQAIYRAAWEDNWGFIPLSDAEIVWLAKELKPLVQKDLLRFAMAEGEVVGFLLALPDWNPALRRLEGSPLRHPLRTLKLMLTARPEKMQGLRVILLGMRESHRKRGFEGVLFAEGLKKSLDLGYRYCEYSWILEDNELTKRTVRLMDAELSKVYRFYEKPL